jgi:choline kinase
MTLVILAAGHGRRFGGLKQLAAVGPEDQSLIDYTALDAAASGLGPIVLVLREEIREEVEEHVRKHWPSSIEWESVMQGPVAGTAPALLAAEPLVKGPFAVANADDHYGLDAMSLLVRRLSTQAEAGDDAELPHVLVGFHLAKTIFTTETVTRGICRLDPSGALVDIVEQKVTPLEGDEGGFVGVEASAEPGSPRLPLSGEEIVSMNLWGFQPRLFEHLRAAVEAFDPPPPPPDAEKPPELLLPDVVQELLRGGNDLVEVVQTTGTCIGITHPRDLDFVRKELANRRPGDEAPVSIAGG